MKVTDTVREALQNWGETRADVARASGISEAVLSRFIRRETAISGDNLDILAEYLGLELVKRRAGKPGKKGK